MTHSYGNDNPQYLSKQIRLKGGVAMIFIKPAPWDVRRISKYDRERYKSGQFVNERYKIGLQIEDT